MSVGYEPGESTSGMFGGNSNWRGPIWFPVNYLLIESLQKFHHYYGDDFKVECPTGSGKLHETSTKWPRSSSNRLRKIFEKDEHGKRPVWGNTKNCRRIPISAITCCFTSTSMETPDVAWAPIIRPDGPA